jgi:primosomal protein DnaI
MKNAASEITLKRNYDVYKELEKNFKKSLEDEKFKNLVSKLKAKPEVLMKYTSELEDSSKEYDHCLHCKNILECKNKLEGYAFLPKTHKDVIDFHYVPCKYKQKQDKQNSFLKNIYLYNVPKEIKQASFTKIYKTDKKRLEVIIWLTEFMEQYKENKNIKGLYLHGNFGCGKSYLISAMFNELAKNGVKSAIVFWPEFLRDLKSSFNSEYKNEFKDKFENIKKAPLLLIDDIGAESVTPWSRDEVLCPLLQYRMDEKLPTFFTSNLNLEALLKHLSFSSKGVEEIKAGRIISRIKQLTTEIEMVSKNLRK